jgi:endonuclease/exonuclease/phosphatase family metal-dependent hydrolase
MRTPTRRARLLEALIGATPSPDTGPDALRVVAPLGPTPPPSTRHGLRVMTWNIAWARGANLGESHQRLMPRALSEDNLRAIAAVIRSHDPDLVLLQEVDFCAKRSAYIDQLAFLARHARLPFTAQALSWTAHYLPFPYWPPSRHQGLVRAGGAILSRLPLRRNLVTRYPKPQQKPWWYNAFYPARYAQQVEVEVAGRWQAVVNCHLEAYDRANRTLQAAQLQSSLRALGDALLLCGGDLNTTPPNATQQHGFWDEPRDDYRGDHTLCLLRDLPHLREVAPPDAPEHAWWTFPSSAPNRRLDYIFFNAQRLQNPSARVAPANGLSDHRPIIATFDL